MQPVAEAAPDLGDRARQRLARGGQDAHHWNAVDHVDPVGRAIVDVRGWRDLARDLELEPGGAAQGAVFVDRPVARRRGGGGLKRPAHPELAQYKPLVAGLGRGHHAGGLVALAPGVGVAIGQLGRAARLFEIAGPHQHGRHHHMAKGILGVGAQQAQRQLAGDVMPVGRERAQDQRAAVLGGQQLRSRCSGRRTVGPCRADQAQAQPEDCDTAQHGISSERRYRRPPHRSAGRIASARRHRIPVRSRHRRCDR